MQSVVVTGASGFLGWHLRCRLRALDVGSHAVARSAWSDPSELQANVASTRVLVHLAGVNRADDPSEVEAGNVRVAEKLARAVEAAGVPLRLVFGNSVHAGRDDHYGRGKERAAELLSLAMQRVGGTFVDVRLPNVFGEHGRPFYNSVVATFCHELATGGWPDRVEDADLELLHAQDAAEELIDACSAEGSGGRRPQGTRHHLPSLLRTLEGMRDTYLGTGAVPVLASQFDVDLFNTLRSHVPMSHFPVSPSLRSDQRGDLFEIVESGGAGLAFVSTTRPGATRGDHFHLRKFERFFVLQGSASIRLRRLFHDDVITFNVDGSRPAFVDMPTMWTHNLTNTGDSDLVTAFWGGGSRAALADQFAEPVQDGAQ